MYWYHCGCCIMNNTQIRWALLAHVWRFSSGLTLISMAIGGTSNDHDVMITHTHSGTA